MKLKVILLLLTAGYLSTFSGCKDPDGDFNIFTIEDDKQFGAQVEAEIAADPVNYPVLNESQYATAYAHLRRITDTILNSGKVFYRNEFLWKTYIIHDDNTLNAFCTPGGYIYVYTGLIKFLESEDELAGVLGHEIAHADKRHSTDALTRQYGIQTLLDIVFGKDKGALARVAANLKELSYGRKAESEADEFSVIYLYPTKYDARGASRFFEKLIANGQSGGTPTFLSTHPDPSNRVEDIQLKWQQLGGKEGGRFLETYQQFKNSLP